MILAPTPIAGMFELTAEVHRDARGAFARLYCPGRFAAAGIDFAPTQINLSVNTHCHTLRGLHFQRPPLAEAKLVRAVAGRVWDVAVDLRAESPGFLAWHAERLSAENGQALLIPEGFAHGFQALTDDAELLYCHSAAYAPEVEGGLNPLDPRLAIAWPLEVSEMSERDRAHPLLDAGFAGVRL